jgi:predicted ATPase/class 3 adenylate cyclase
VHRIIPELIIENYRARRYGGSFKAASMFLDISGFSVMTDALMGQGRGGAEELAVTMRAVFDPLVEAIFGQGGMIVGYAGDSISALFEIDTDEASAARRALACARLIQQGLRAKPVFETPYGEFHISAKIGLAIGSVSWGILPSRKGDKAVYFFRGDAVEAAARAEHQATAGDIILTDGMRKELADDIDTSPLAGFQALRQVSGKLPAPRPVDWPAVDPATAAIFAPREIITQDLQGEFRQTVHMFVRIPDLADEQLAQFMYTFFELQARYGGLLDRIDFGDKGCNLAVVWGAPTAHENDIDRALSFILDLRSSVDFPVCAGITYYTSYAGYIGGRLYETYAAYGWGMNLAARFMAGASENDIWLDERICQRIERRFRSEFVGEQNFKGFAQKQKVFVLRGRKTGVEMFFRGKMVGRESQLQALAEFVAPLWDGKYAGAVGIWGDAGIGKSRLVYEFRRSPLPEGRSCLWALCQADEILRPSFNPFRYWLLKYFGILPGQDHATRSRQFSTKLDEVIVSTGKDTLAGELKRGRGFLAALVDVEWPDPLYQQLDAQGRYDNTILALISLLKAESRRQPLILFMEDAQYLDEESKAFVPRLKRALAADPGPYPIAILMAARLQDAKGLLEVEPVDRQIDLQGLSDDSVSLMAEEFLGQRAASALVTMVNERADGNPFFVEQILRYLQEQDLVEFKPSGQWTIKPTGKSSALPADISAMLVARLDRLAGPVKESIQAASVLGRVFDLPVLARMIGNQRSLHNEVAAAERAAVWSPLSETRYIFNHALLRDVAYNMQLQARRRQLHALAFEALKDLFGGEAHRHYGELAFHSEQAALAAEAHRYLSLAGDSARDEYQNARALDYYRRALAVLSPTDLQGRYALQRECEKIVAEHGTLDERTREVEALQALADGMGETANLAEALLLRSRLVSSSGEYEKSAELARQARELALVADREDLAIGANLSLLVSFYQRGRYKEAVEHGEAALALARKQNALQDEAYILNWLGLAFLEMKNPSTARTYFEQSLSIFRAEYNVRGMARVLTQFGSVAGFQGNYTSALD